MRELNQNHINYITLLNVFAILGVIFFFFRKWKEMMDREESNEKRISSLEKSVVDSNNHFKAVLTHVNKRINNSQITTVTPSPKPVQLEEEQEKPTGRNDFEEAMASLM